MQAAIELLIGHQRWLCRDDLVDQFVRLIPALAGQGTLAVVSWRAAVRALSAGRLPCSDNEGHVLRIAASLAEGLPADLSDCLSTLDNINAGLVVDAMLQANGRRVSGRTR